MVWLNLRLGWLIGRSVAGLAAFLVDFLVLVIARPLFDEHDIPMSSWQRN